MNIKTKLHADYHQDGGYDHPQDEFEMREEITGPKSLYKFMKEITIRDAWGYNRIGYCGTAKRHWHFFEERYVIIDEEKFQTHRPVQPPDYFLEVIERYQMVMDRLKTVLPYLQAGERKREQERRERKRYEQLKKKYDE